MDVEDINRNDGLETTEQVLIMNGKQVHTKAHTCASTSDKYFARSSFSLV